VSPQAGKKRKKGIPATRTAPIRGHDFLEEATLLFLYILRWPKTPSSAAKPPIRADTGTTISNKSKRRDSSRKNVAAMTLTSVIQCDFTTDLFSTDQESLTNPRFHPFAFWSR
jgi:hypothetical protein